MKPPSNKALFLALTALLLAAPAVKAGETLHPSLFAPVPQGDSTYDSLRKLVQGGYLPSGSVPSSLTRYEAAALILKARRAYDDAHAITVAQGLDLSGPEAVVQHEDKPQGAASTEAAPGAGNPSAEPTAAPTPTEEEVRRSLTTLQQAYSWELSRIKGDVKQVTDREGKLADQDYRIWKAVKSLSNQPSISLHGFGRGMALSTRQFGSAVGYPFSSATFPTFLDLAPEGVVARQISWTSIFRMSSDLTGNSASNKIDLKRLSIQFEPGFMSNTIGDFNLHWTPFTVWNRNSLDREFTPGILERFDSYRKYPTFLDHAPDMPLRGIRFGTRLMWPDSKTMDSFKVDGFIHQVRSGYSHDTTYLNYRYSGWIFAGMAELKAKKFVSVSGYGLLYDEPLDTDAPAAVYNPSNPSTWARQYQVGSVSPKITVPFDQDKGELGAVGEAASSKYLDDKHDATRAVTDWAVLGGLFARYLESTLQVRYLNVGYAFYSPLAQIRQVDDSTGTLMNTPVQFASNPAISALGRPNELFKFYNRLQDNVFPYGLSTPNRKGVGVDLDVKALDKNALKLKASAYQVQEMDDNFVVGASGQGFATVDGTWQVAAPLRKFTYINAGPWVDVAALAKLKRRLDLGVNVRSETTKSDVGTLTGTTVDAGLGVGVYGDLEAEAAGGMFQGQGKEMGYGGVPLARTPYPYVNDDLGAYQVFDANQKTQYAAISLLLRIDRHSLLTSDFLVKTETGIPNVKGTLKTQTWDVTYEVRF